MVGILVCFWEGLFSGAMLVSGRVRLTGKLEVPRTPKLKVYASEFFSRIVIYVNRESFEAGDTKISKADHFW